MRKYICHVRKHHACHMGHIIETNAAVANSAHSIIFAIEDWLCILNMVQQHGKCLKLQSRPREFGYVGPSWY